MYYTTKIQNLLDENKKAILDLLKKKSEIPLCSALGNECPSYKKLTQHINQQIVDLGSTKIELERKFNEVKILENKLMVLDFKPEIIRAYRSEKSELQNKFQKYLHLGEQEVILKFNELEIRLLNTKAKLDEKEKDYQRIGELEIIEVKDYKSEILGQKNRKYEIESKISSLKVSLERFKSLKDTLSKKKEKYDMLKGNEIFLNKELQILEILSNAFSNKGIPNMIIETILPILETYSNEMLQEIFPSMAVKFETERDKASGDGTISVLDIIVTDNGNERPLENYSGAEEQTVNFAVRRALSKLLSEMHGINIKFLCIDEAILGFSQGLESSILRVLQTMQSEFNQILMISHIQSVKDIFQNQIFISKENGVSLVS